MKHERVVEQHQSGGWDERLRTFIGFLVVIDVVCLALWLGVHWVGALEVFEGISLALGAILGTWLYFLFHGSRHKKKMQELERREYQATIRHRETITRLLDDTHQMRHNYKTSMEGNLEVIHQLPPPSVKVTEVKEDVKELPPPLPQLSGRELIIQGHVERALSAGKYLLGYDEQSKLRDAPQRDLYNLLLAGIPGSGKSTTGLWLAGQRVKAGGLYMVSDPHLYYQDDEGRKSLGESLAPFSASRIVETDDGSVSGLLVKLNHMLRELTKRQKPGYIVRAQDNWLWMIDEFNSTIDVIEDAGKTEQFSKGLALLQREGRKFGLHTMLMGHRFSRDDIGKVKIRSVASNILEHKMTDAQQAKILIGSKGAKAVDLNIGDYLLSGILSTSIERIHTPVFETRDMYLLFGSSTTSSKPRPGTVQSSKSYVQTEPLDEPGTQPDETMDELPDHLRAKVVKVLEMDQQKDVSQSEMIRRIWGVEPQGRPGLAATDELRIIRAYLAQLLQQKGV